MIRETHSETRLFDLYQLRRVLGHVNGLPSTPHMTKPHKRKKKSKEKEKRLDINKEIIKQYLRK